MGKKLFVGNLPFSASDANLNEWFSEHGTVESAKVIMDRATGRSKGFGFVEMSSDNEAQTALGALNGATCEGRPLSVSEARPMAPREDRGFGGGNRERRGSGGGGFGRNDRDSY